ncbi:MAG: cellulase family glycosylhydrolase [Pseudoxanthomonas sp.]
MPRTFRPRTSTIALLLCAALAGPAVVNAQAVPPQGQASAVAGASDRWSADRANAWYREQPWLVGANFAPSNAINQLEMFQAATFDPATIDRELGWAHEKYGMNTMRVYLHDLLWKQDAKGLVKRIDQFLEIAQKHGIRPVFVLFDSCWDPDPVLGAQHRPIPGVHNSGWVQSPGRHTLVDPASDAHLRNYVQGVVGAFAKDERVLAWDIWNEPDNPGGGNYEGKQLPQEQQRIAELLPKAFGWARAKSPVQPLTSGVWIGKDWSPGAPTLTAIQKAQLAHSDIITFHNYEQPEFFEARITQLRPYGRPLICTEWMARGSGSAVDTILPLARKENIGMINWGLVDGAIQTRMPWDSWDRPYTMKEPVLWFHDLMKADGTPYREREAELFRDLAKQPSVTADAAR